MILPDRFLAVDLDTARNQVRVVDVRDDANPKAIPLLTAVGRSPLDAINRMCDFIDAKLKEK